MEEQMRFCKSCKGFLEIAEKDKTDYGKTKLFYCPHCKTYTNVGGFEE